MAQKTLDTRQLMTGKDGRMYIEIDGQMVHLANIDTFNVVMNINAVDVQPVGSITVAAVPTGVSFDLTFTEMVVASDIILAPLLEAIRNGKMPVYAFQTAFEAPDGKIERLALRDCMPSGTFGLQNLVPGEVIKREQSFRVNQVPEFIEEMARKSELMA